MVSLLPASFHSSIANVCIEVHLYPLFLFFFFVFYDLIYALFLREIISEV